MQFRIRKGLDVAIGGEPQQSVSDGPQVARVALLGPDYLDVRPNLLVDEGDHVKCGQVLFEDRRQPRIKFTSPGSGTVAQINRGERRALESVVIELEGNEEERFAAYDHAEIPDLSRDRVVENLLNSGLWTAIRTRPYSKVPNPEAEPHAIFVTAMDSDPLAPRSEGIVGAHPDDFETGLNLLSRLTPGRVFLCTYPDAAIPRGDPEKIILAEFSGPHPAGLPGTHIHFLAPVTSSKTAWYVNCQDVIAIGKLFTTGRLWVERIIALAGPLVHQPRLIRTRLGASTEDLLRDEIETTERRVVSGSILSGRHAVDRMAYLGRYHNQVAAVAEFSSHGARRPGPTTALHGRPVALIPIDAFERVMPLDILPVPLLRALIVGDTDMAQALGCLELDEEDLALCTFVCPGKQDYGPLLRSILSRIEKEG